MKLKIKIRRLKETKIPQIIDKGDWVDLYIPKYERFELKKGDLELIDLGFAVKLPNGFEAIMACRSSTPSKAGVIFANSIGIIDNSYSGNNDSWKIQAYAIKDTTIYPESRIAQFRIQLSQKATIWQKLKWLFCSGIEIEEVEYLDSKDRGGIGSTGVF